MLPKLLTAATLAMVLLMGAAAPALADDDGRRTVERARERALERLEARRDNWQRSEHQRGERREYRRERRDDLRDERRERREELREDRRERREELRDDRRDRRYGWYDPRYSRRYDPRYDPRWNGYPGQRWNGYPNRYPDYGYSLRGDGWRHFDRSLFADRYFGGWALGQFDRDRDGRLGPREGRYARDTLLYWADRNRDGYLSPLEYRYLRGLIGRGY